MGLITYGLGALVLALTVAAGGLALAWDASKDEAARWKQQAEDAHTELVLKEAAIGGLQQAADAATARAKVAAAAARAKALERPALPPTPTGCDEAAAWAREQAPVVLEGWR